MIVARVSEPDLRRAVREAAHPEEDCVVSSALAEDALQRGWVRLLVRSGEAAIPGGFPGVPVLELDAELLRRWENDRRRRHPPPSRVPFLTERLRVLMERASTDGTWVDSTLAGLARATGAPLPLAFRAFARRVLEFPSHYADLHTMARVCGMSRGALKARFRRRGLASPFAYMRWLRVLAVSEALSDPSVTVARAAHRLGYSSDGNLCRTIVNVTGLKPTDMRSAGGRKRLLIAFAWEHLSGEALSAWAEMDELFARAA